MRSVNVAISDSADRPVSGPARIPDLQVSQSSQPEKSARLNFAAASPAS